MPNMVEMEMKLYKLGKNNLYSANLSEVLSQFLLLFLGAEAMNEARAKLLFIYFLSKIYGFTAYILFYLSAKNIKILIYLPCYYILSVLRRPLNQK